MRERMSFAGRREGLEDWVWWAALRAFLALEREVGVGLWWVGDGGVDIDDDDESLSGFAEEGVVVGKGRGIMSSLEAGEEGGFMLAREMSSASSVFWGLVGGAMIF